MLPIISLIGKYVAKLGIEVAIEVGAKSIIKKISKTIDSKDRLNSSCSSDECSGFRVQDPDNAELVYCGNCKTVTARYKVNR